LQVAAQWGVIVLFVVLFVGGLGTVAYMIWLVLKASKRAAVAK
jgi:hypothetical protein